MKNAFLFVVGAFTISASAEQSAVLTEELVADATAIESDQVPSEAHRSLFFPPPQPAYQYPVYQAPPRSSWSHTRFQPSNTPGTIVHHGDHAHLCSGSICKTVTFPSVGYSPYRGHWRRLRGTDDDKTQSTEETYTAARMISEEVHAPTYLLSFNSDVVSTGEAEKAVEGIQRTTKENTEDDQASATMIDKKENMSPVIADTNKVETKSIVDNLRDLRRRLFSSFFDAFSSPSYRYGSRNYQRIGSRDYRRSPLYNSRPSSSIRYYDPLTDIIHTLDPSHSFHSHHGEAPQHSAHHGIGHWRLLRDSTSVSDTNVASRDTSLRLIDLGSTAKVCRATQCQVFLTAA